MNGSNEIAQHDCNITKCNICFALYDNSKRHECYMPVIVEKRKIDSDENSGALTPKRYVFFDTEAWLNDIPGEEFQNGKMHKTCCVVAIVACTSCLGEGAEQCKYCQIDKLATFFGRDSVDKFCDWLFTYQEVMKSELTVIAHNLGAYDIIPVLGYLYKHNTPPDVIFRGNKLLQMFIPSLNITFIDSLNYLKMPLKKMPKALGIDSDGCLEKGHFPYLFNTEENAGKIFDTLPEKSNYGLEIDERYAWD